MAINNPTIRNYKPFYIAANSDTSAAKDTKQEYGLIAKTNPYPALPKAKEPYRNEWKDAHGDDEEIGDGLYMEAFEFSVDFYVRAIGTTAAADVRGAISNFFNAVKGAQVRYFDSYTALGYKDVRYVGYEEKMFQVTGSGANATARCIFTITFKVNDPVTRMVLTTSGQNKYIVAAS